MYPLFLFPNIQWGFKGLEEVINIHPLFVHFPIALLLTSFVFYLLGTIFKNEGLLASGKWALYFGTLSAAVTVWSGLEAAKPMLNGRSPQGIMAVHQYLGYAVLGVSFLLSAWVFFSKAHIPSKGRPAFLLALAVLGMMLAQGADLGGRMAFWYGMGVGKKSTAQKEHGGHEHGGKEHGSKEHGGKEPAVKEQASKEHGGKEHGGKEHGGHEH